MNAEVFSQWCDGIFKIFAMGAMVVAGIWAVIEYDNAKEQKRIERSMDYVNSLETARVNEAVEHISNFWRSYGRDSTQGTSRDEEIIRIVYEEEGYQRALENVLNHLDEVAYCIEYQVCDGTIVLRTKRGLFMNGFVNHRPWIEHHRQETGHTKYFQHLECFVRETVVGEDRNDDFCS